ncbi:MAG: SDR family NAD(P)-dependent oxidoreductase, partial [Acidimicrobiia bacterium]
MQIDGRVAVVTGAGAGIGAAIARRLAQEGAALVVADIDEGAGGTTAEAITAAGGRAVFVPADVGRAGDVEAMVEVTMRTFGRVDIVVNNAGIVANPGFPHTDPEVWMRVVDVNLRGVMFGTHYAIRAMGDGGGGAIVNIASLAGVGLHPHPAPEYAATKAAVVRFSAALAPLAQELGIRVNCVCPDWVDTPMSRRGRARMSAAELAAVVPPVLLQPEEIADAVVELVSDDSLSGRVMCCWCDQPRS